MKKEFLISFLYDYFNIGNISDVSQNGLQVDSSKSEIRKIAFAVDANLETICAAASQKADMLFVHHGMFWSHSLTITGNHYNRIAALIRNDIALFGVHLPLDLHKKVGNNSVMAKKLGLEDITEFGMYKGINIGWMGTHREGLEINECARLLGFNAENDMKAYEFLKKKNRKIAIVSGGAADDVSQAASAGADLFISGEHSHTAYSTAKENGVNMLLGGHYKSEIFGVQATSEMLKNRFPELECVFLDLPSGM